MPIWRLMRLVFLARRGWRRIPPEQRRAVLRHAGNQVRTHGPGAARRIGTAVRSARRPR
jgi:hypothetical protein